MNRQERKIMGLTTTSHGLVHLYEGVLPPLLPLVMAEFGADFFTMGIVVSVFSYAFGIGSLPAGILADKVGPRRLISIYLFGAGTVGVLVLPTGSLIYYGIIMGMMGAFCSAYHPSANALISIGIKEKGNAFGIHGIAGSIGVAIVPVLSAWIGIRMGWRAPHVLFGLIGIGAGLYSLTLPRYPVLDTEDTRQSGSSATAEKKAGALSLTFLFLSATTLGLTYKGIMTFLPTYMGHNVTINFLEMDVVAIGGLFATLSLMSGAVGQYVSGRMADRYPVEKIYLAAVVMGTVFVFIMSVSTGFILVLASICYAFFYFSVQPAQNYLVSQYLPPHRQGFGFGILFILAFGVGSTAAAISGYIADVYGLQSVFLAMGFCFVVSSGLVLGLVLQAKK